MGCILGVRVSCSLRMEESRKNGREGEVSWMGRRLALRSVVISKRKRSEKGKEKVKGTIGGEAKTRRGGYWGNFPSHCMAGLMAGIVELAMCTEGDREQP